MAEEYDNNEQEIEDEEMKDIWSLLNVDNSDDEYEDMQADADEEVAKEDKMVKKLSSKMDNMQKKFEATMMRERINAFEKDANDIEKGLFKTVAADVKDMASLDKALGLVRERAGQMQAEADKYRAQLEEQAQQQVAKAWGTGPVGTPTPKTKDYMDEQMKKVASGDIRAAFDVVIGDDWPGGR